MSLPAAVLRDVLWTKAPPARTDAKVQICLQSQISRRLETGMDDCVAAVTAAVAAYRRLKNKIKNIGWYSFWGLLDLEDTFVSREHICSFCNVRRTAGSSSVQIRKCWRPFVQYCLHGTLRPSSRNRVVVQVSPWHGAGHDLRSCGACTTTRMQLAGRTVPCKHTEKHRTQKNRAVNSQTSGLTVSIFLDYVFYVP